MKLDFQTQSKKERKHGCVRVYVREHVNPWLVQPSAAHPKSQSTQTADRTNCCIHTSSPVTFFVQMLKPWRRHSGVCGIRRSESHAIALKLRMHAGDNSGEQSRENPDLFSNIPHPWVNETK